MWLFEDATRIEMIRFIISNRIALSCPAKERIISFIFLNITEFYDYNVKSGWSSVILANVWRRVALKQILSFWKGPDAVSSIGEYTRGELILRHLSWDAREPWGIKRIRIRDRRGNRGPPSGVEYSMVESCSCSIISFSLSQTLNIKWSQGDYVSL